MLFNEVDYSSRRPFSVTSLFIIAQLILRCTSIVPSFDINLDEPPERRWLGVVNYYKAELVSMLDTLLPVIGKNFQDKQAAWLGSVAFDPEYEAELTGIARALNHGSVTVERLKFMNMLYEMESPTACTGVLWTMPNGTVVHGRNMDYEFHFSVEDRSMNWPDVTFDATLHRGGVPLMKITQWPGAIGVHTGMRLAYGPGTGWSFQQNTRQPNLWQDNLEAAKQGGQVFGLAVRRIMETTPDFSTARAQLYNTRLMAPQYFVIGGSGPYEGSVLTMDRLGQHLPNTPPMQHVTQGNSAWHLVQTNDDLLSPPKDDRRPTAEFLMSTQTQQVATEPENMKQLLHTPSLLNQATVFTTVMIPATGYYQTSLPADSPMAGSGESSMRALPGLEAGMGTLQAAMMQGPPSQPTMQFGSLALSEKSNTKTELRILHRHAKRLPFLSRVRRELRAQEMSGGSSRTMESAAPELLDEASFMQLNLQMNMRLET